MNLAHLTKMASAATRMVLHLTYDDKSKYVAVPFDKDLGSAETSAEIARAFGVSAGRVEGISVVIVQEKTVQEKTDFGTKMVAKKEKRYIDMPLNLNGHDLAHPYNTGIKNFLFNIQDRWRVEVKFAIERSFREHE